MQLIDEIQWVLRNARLNASDPALIHRVMELGVDIVTLAPMSQTLEEIYLQVVKVDEQQKGDADEHLS